MSHNRTPKAACAAFASLVSLAGMPAAAAAGDFVVVPQTASVAYAMHAETDAPDGVHHIDEHVTIANRGAEYLTTIAMGDTNNAVPLTLAAGELRAANATASPAPSDDDEQRISSTVGTLNILVASTQFAPTPLAMGSQWQSTLHLALPGGDVATIPLAMTTPNVHGNDIHLTAHGAGSGTLHKKGHTLNAQIVVDVAAEFVAGRIVSATVTRTITGHVFIKTISFKETWTVTS